MALNKVEICGVNTSKLPVLTAEEKKKKDSGCRIVVIYFSKNDSHIAVDLYFDRENIKNIGP